MTIAHPDRRRGPRARRRRRAPARAPDRPSCSASTARTRRASPPRSRRSRATPSATRGGGRVEFARRRTARAPQLLAGARVSDEGPGIADLRRILGGQYRSTDRHGARHRRRAPPDGPLRDRVRAGPRHHGRAAARSCRAPRRWSRAPSVAALVAALARERADDPLAEVQQQNQELLRALDELQPAPGRAGRGSTASWRTPTAAWWRSTPSSTRRPTTCAAPTR